MDRRIPSAEGKHEIDEATRRIDRKMTGRKMTQDFRRLQFFCPQSFCLFRIVLCELGASVVQISFPKIRANPRLVLPQF